ncbi:hypothetical protein EV196_102251 [Mariniflexile fucanivorans]|uniref:MORN repeat protein n=1 Tax=Mariniflexile fucanivorans TaxID=264023 RepID=A0A4R1RN14_9FLAO|nr:hypothetical protein [Mariniflexile fucanivorans]TCL67691.1 hypothetical protein EV196_102251 [Mariniflexile fucanivorans]
MKTTLILILAFFSTFMFSQNDAISGSYYQSSGSPEGGANFIVMPNNHFVVAYFGGIQKGTWKLEADGTYEFKYHAEPKFVLYGRHNTRLKDSISVSLAVDGNKGIAFRFNGSTDDIFTPMFNKGANCFSYPYIYKQKDKLISLDAFSPDYKNYDDGRQGDLPGFYSFKIEESYNDFIVAGLSEEYSQGGSFRAKYKDGVLLLDEMTNLEKRGDSEDLDEETLSFVTRHTEFEIFPKLLEYRNEFFPHYDDPTDEDMIPYTKIDSVNKSSKDIIVSEAYLFYTSCED